MHTKTYVAFVDAEIYKIISSVLLLSLTPLLRIFRHFWSKPSTLQNALTATQKLKERVASRGQELVEKNLKGRNSQINTLAVLAATLEDLVHCEEIKRLTDAFAGGRREEGPKS